jgi:hypothetical protein
LFPGFVFGICKVREGGERRAGERRGGKRKRDEEGDSRRCEDSREGGGRREVPRPSLLASVSRSSIDQKVSE